MTPSERERRIEAARSWMLTRNYTIQSILGETDAAGIIDAADEVVPMVSEAALNKVLDALRDLHSDVEMAESVGICLPGRAASLRAGDVLARHPSFSGEEGTGDSG